MIRRLVCTIFFLVGLAGAAGAYEVETHRDLSVAAAVQSIFGAPAGRMRLGLTKPIDEGEKYPNSKGTQNTVLDLIRDGAKFEDDLPRSVHHFFNPRTGGPLAIDPNSFSFLSPYEEATTRAIIADVNANAQTSPDWALGATFVTSVANQYSLKSAREYFYQGLTNPVTLARRSNLGLLFESLGRIIHHVQDMAQPQHVRNDAHLHDSVWEQDCNARSTFSCDLYHFVSRPSTYELWTNRADIRPNLPLNGYAPVYAASGQGTDGLTDFVDARRFWTNSGRGIADFTNRNFFSAGTMQVAPPYAGGPYQVNVAALCAGAIPNCEAVIDPDDVTTFLPSVVDDQFRAVSLPNPYAAGASLLDPEYRTRTGTGIPTVNRFTFQYDHAYLLPRAVGYSAGLINYFFRGELAISLPDEGVYGVADTSAGGCGAPCGFRRLKLKLKNVTPGNEVMGAGTLVAVVKFHRNTCYQPDLSGDYGGPNFAGNSCRSVDEEIAVSQPLAVSPATVTDVPKLFAFDFGPASGHPDSTIPINATDVYLQVVFRGKLGQEDDAVAVTTVNIAEPNYIALTNVTDYVFADLAGGDQHYHPLGYGNVTTTVPVSNLRLSFKGSADADVIATMPLLDGGHQAQIAFLTDNANPHYWLSGTSALAYEPYENQPYPTQEFVLDETVAPSVYRRNCPVFAKRGLYHQYHISFVQGMHGVVAWGEKAAARALTAGGGGLAQVAGGPIAPKLTALNCAVATTGMYDFSTMAPFTAASAKPWLISPNF
jgi:hypothetical protein